MRGLGIADRLRWIAGDIRRNGPIVIWWQIKIRLSPAERAKQRRIVRDGQRYDTEHGYKTAPIVTLDNLDIVGASDGAKHYQPVPVEGFDTALALIDVPFETASFIDLGSGMGRAVLMAAERPFQRVIGVEFAREFHEIAVANLERREAAHGPDPRIALVHDNAASLPVPDGPLIYFLYNSFGPPILTEVLAKIHGSWREEPRPVRLIYYNAEHRDELARAGFRTLSDPSNPLFTIFEPA